VRFEVFLKSSMIRNGTELVW